MMFTTNISIRSKVSVPVVKVGLLHQQRVRFTVVTNSVTFLLKQAKKKHIKNKLISSMWTLSGDSIVYVCFQGQECELSSSAS